MASWNELLREMGHVPQQNRFAWVKKKQQEALAIISAKRQGRNVIFYASAFLQKPNIPAAALQIATEDINAFMSVMYRMDWGRGLTLLLHTPGGLPGAAETIVEYLCAKFSDFEVVIPTLAMSAGTMVSLASDRLIMGRQSQLGPIDPQMIRGGDAVSAQAIVDQFEQARTEIMADQRAAHLWAPVLQSIGPGLLQQARNALDYGEEMVGRWLARRMFSSATDPAAEGNRVAKYFNDATQHKSHGRRIDRNEARSLGLIVEDLETDQEFQDAVLTAYHLVTIGFENTAAVKVVLSNHDRMWLKNAAVIHVPAGRGNAAIF